MKRIKTSGGNPTQENIITGDDINMSSPFNNQTLTEVLTDQKEQVDMLTRNVKYLTKYGGVGGGPGGGGTGKVKTKFNCSITYTDLNGERKNEALDPSKPYIIDKNFPVTFTVQLTSTVTLSKYALFINIPDSQPIKVEFSGTDKICSASFFPDINATYQVMVSGETTSTVDAKIYVKTRQFTSLLYRGDLTMSSGQEIYSTNIDVTRYRIVLTNLLPSEITNDKLTGIKINDDFYEITGGKITLNGKQYMVDTVNSDFGEMRTHTLEIQGEDIFKDFGIYKIMSYYEFGSGDPVFTSLDFIYKDEPSFVYCYSESTSPTLYLDSGKGFPTDPLYSNSYTESFIYRLYGRRDVELDHTYNINYTIFKEGDENTNYESLGVISLIDNPEKIETIEEQPGTLFYTTYSEKGGSITATGRSTTSGSSVFYKVTITKNSGPGYTKKIESYFEPVSSITPKVNYRANFSNSYVESDFTYVKFTGNNFRIGISYYTKVDSRYVLTKDKSPQAGVEYYTVIPKLVTISFKVTDIGRDGKDYSTETTYFVYVGRTKDLEFVFTNNSGDNYYAAIHANTATVNNTVMDFPWEEGKYKLEEDSKTFRFKSLNSLCQRTLSIPTTEKISTGNNLPNVHTFVSGTGDINDGKYLYSFGDLADKSEIDAMFSFGLRYNGDNYESPVLKITISSTIDVTLYKTKVVLRQGESFTTYDRFVLPSDSEYHLISFYFKYNYSINGQEYTVRDDDYDFNLLIFIDGIVELSPIKIFGRVAITYDGTSITYYRGLWDYDYIGIMTMNGKPTGLDLYSEYMSQKLLRRYYHDFDPIIPSNYYQAYKEYQAIQNNGTLPSITFNASIYGTLGDSTNWINYYGTEIGEEKLRFNKFIQVTDPNNIIKLTKLPSYLIKLTASNSGDEYMNSFLQNTLTSYSGEDNVQVPEYKCRFQKMVSAGETYTATDLINCTFTVKYQGSSTLLYGVKNFSIVADSVKTTSDEVWDYYWTPNKELFKPEKGFNLKADMVDSSHSNNVIIGNFVNEYFTDSDNPGFGSKEDGIRPCLTGMPVLLFMTDQTKGSNNPNYILLGIYNLNLNRSSVMNLGYQKIDTESKNCTQIDSSFSEVLAYTVKSGSEAVQIPNRYVVAEVQGNESTLYDYSQYDRGNLMDMFGDFYTYDGIRVSESYDSAIEKAFKGLNRLVNQDILGGDTPTFNVLEISNSSLKSLDEGGTYYYYNDDGNVVVLDGDKKKRCLSWEDINNIGTYMIYKEAPGGRKISIVGNPKYKFHAVVDRNGNRVKQFVDGKSAYYYYLEELNTVPTWNHLEDDKFHYINVLKYYIVCMAFAMVDSVQKNLTIKCRNFDRNKANTWYLGFYDMDTAFGVDNIGSPVDYKAFSDYIDSTGDIIQDYFPKDETERKTLSGSLFDIPSSYLFLFAKYGNIFHTNTENPLITDTLGKDRLYHIPLQYWINLRQAAGTPGAYFSSAADFCSRFVDGYFEEINPLVWNLNYFYKYFSETKNTNSKDTEISKFNGTMRHRRLFWLDNRFKILDVLFGIKNDQRIGRSSYYYHGDSGEKTLSSGNNPDIEINNTMFGGFNKGYTGTFSIDLEGPARTPIVFQYNANQSKLFIIDDSGKLNGIQANINNSTDCGFYGTRLLTKLNEFGQFLYSTVNTNTIENQRITDIVVKVGSGIGKMNNLQIDLTNVKSVKNITIDVSNSINRGFNSITITSSSDSLEFNLEKVEIIGAVVGNNLSISGRGHIFINKLIIRNCTISTLSLNGLTINQENTFTNNQISTYNLNGRFKNLNISDNKCLNFNINSSSGNSISCILPSVVSGTISGSYSTVKILNSVSDSLSSAAQTMENLTVNGINCSSLTFRGSKARELRLNLDSSLQTINLCLGQNTSLKVLTINGQSLTDIYYMNGAFYGVTLDSYLIERGGKTAVDFTQSSIQVHYDGSQIFYYSDMHRKYMVPVEGSNVKYHLSSNVGLRQFTYHTYNIKDCHGITEISEDGNGKIVTTTSDGIAVTDIARLFSEIIIDDYGGSWGGSGKATTIDLNGTFNGVHFVDGINPKSITNGNDLVGPIFEETYQIPEEYFTLVEALKTFNNNLSKCKRASGIHIDDHTGFLKFTNISILTSELINLLGNSRGSYSSDIGQMVPKGLSGHSSEHVVFVEKGLLGKFDTISLADVSDANGYRRAFAIFFERTMLDDESDTRKSGMRIIKEAKVSDAFGTENIVTTTISSVGFYTDKEVSFDFRGGLPGSIRTVSSFGHYLRCGLNLRNLNQMFYKVSPTCTVNLDRIMNAKKSGEASWDSSSYTLENELDLYDFFIKTDAISNKPVFRFTPNFYYKLDLSKPDLDALQNGSAYRSDSVLGFTYPKKITGTNLSKLLSLIKYGDGSDRNKNLKNQMDYLFSNCSVTISGNDGFEKLIKDTNVTDCLVDETAYYTYFDSIQGFVLGLPDSGMDCDMYREVVLEGGVRKYEKVHLIYNDLENRHEYENGAPIREDDIFYKPSYPKTTDGLHSINGTFYNFHMYASGNQITEASYVNTDVIFNDPNNNNILTVANAFERCSVLKPRKPLGIAKNCRSYYKAYYNCSHITTGFPEANKTWTNNTGATGMDNYSCVGENGTFPMIPDGFFNNCKGANINYCFASGAYSSTNAKGQLFSTTGSNPWWTGGTSTVSSYQRIIDNSLVFPVKGESSPGSSTTPWYIFPYWYMSICQCKTYIPVFTVSSQTSGSTTTSMTTDVLYIFQKVDPDGHLYGGSLPSLPPKRSTGDLEGVLKGNSTAIDRDFSVYLYEEGQGLSLAANGTYAGIIPLSLAACIHLVGGNVLIDQRSLSVVNLGLDTNHPLISGASGYSSNSDNKPDGVHFANFHFIYWKPSELSDNIKSFVVSS